MKKRNALLIGLSSIAVTLVVVVIVCGVSLVKNNAGGRDSYQKQLALGIKYAEAGDYQSAIAVYKAAIESYPGIDDAYCELATLYSKTMRLEEAKAILKEGIQKTASVMLGDLYYKLFNERYIHNAVIEDEQSIEKKVDKNIETEEIVFNGSACQIFANYTYSDFINRFSAFTEKTDANTYSYYSSDFGGTLYFYDEDSVDRSIDEERRCPYDDVRPNYIVLEDLSSIFIGLNGDASIGEKDVSDMGATNVYVSTDIAFGRYIHFEYLHSIFEISVDSNDKFIAKADNRIWSEFGTGAQDIERSFDGKIQVISATTADPVAQAEVDVRPIDSNDIVQSCVADYDGYCSLSLMPGDYEASVSIEGYITESFEFTVFTSGQYSESTWIISPELQSGEIRIVLEWGDYPRDLDSYYFDESGTIRVAYYSKEYYDNGELVASLDVDDTNGYGPETITVYDTTRDFSYSICDYTGSGTLFTLTDVTVKLYLPNESSPWIFSPPSNNSGENAWGVFEYVDGEVIAMDEVRGTQSGDK